MKPLLVPVLFGNMLRGVPGHSIRRIPQEAAGLVRGRQQAGMRFQPGFRVAIIRTRLLDVSPVARGVVHLPQVHQLVEDDVVAHERRKLNEPPVQ